MSNRSYNMRDLGLFENTVFFQFPVGMSNRSYILGFDKGKTANILFQFPVGMSNRSYPELPNGLWMKVIAFNSPWECRIGLTFLC